MHVLRYRDGMPEQLVEAPEEIKALRVETCSSEVRRA